jgi:broad-specificity NMP kinase
MIRIIGTRGSGKTTKLLKLAEEEGYILVEPNARMADYVRHMATEKGYYKANVISVHELLYRQHGVIREKYLVDELESFLISLGVEGYSEDEGRLLR